MINFPQHSRVRSNNILIALLEEIYYNLKDFMLFLIE